MGALTALDLSGLRLELALRFHLTTNHYPPIPTSMIPCCIRAIKKANKGEWDRRVRLPSNVSYKGQRLAPVREVVESAHLQWFLEEEVEL